MSYVSEIRVNGESAFISNDMRFATHAEAMAYGADLATRWLAVVEVRAVSSDDPVNYRFGAVRLENAA